MQHALRAALARAWNNASSGNTTLCTLERQACKPVDKQYAMTAVSGIVHNAGAVTDTLT